MCYSQVDNLKLTVTQINLTLTNKRLVNKPSLNEGIDKWTVADIPISNIVKLRQFKYIIWMNCEYRVHICMCIYASFVCLRNVSFVFPLLNSQRIYLTI